MSEAVIFDWDGTLADTKAVIVEAFQKVLAEIGCVVDDDFIARRIGVGDKSLFRDAFKEKGIGFDESMLEELGERKDAIQLALSTRASLLPGAVDLLASLRTRIKTALASMSSRRIIEELLAKRGLRGYFDAVVTVDDVLEPKPNPEIFLKAASLLKVRPEGCVVVEDSIFGVKAAKDGGMRCVAVATGFYSVQELRREGADLVVPSLMERERILSFIFGE